MCDDSDVDVSFKSSCNDTFQMEQQTQRNNVGCDNAVPISLTLREYSLTQSEKRTLSSDKDYDTCMEESLSEDVTTKIEKASVQGESSLP